MLLCNFQNCYCKGNKSKYWEKKQLRPYPDGPSTWKGKVFGVQCFFGFQKMDTLQGTHKATFGGWLPDDAVASVREWLDTVRFTKCAQASRVFSCIIGLPKAVSALQTICCGA